MSNVVIIDRVGGLVEGAQSSRLDSLEKLRLVRGVIPALLKLRGAGYDLVVVGNEPGLGTDEFPRERFDAVDGYIGALFSSQGVDFAASFVCAHRADEACACRLPGVGLVREFLAQRTVNRERSAVVGVDPHVLELALNLGMTGLTLGSGQSPDWHAIVHALARSPACRDGAPADARDGHSRRSRSG